MATPGITCRVFRPSLVGKKPVRLNNIFFYFHYTCALLPNKDVNVVTIYPYIMLTFFLRPVKWLLEGRWCWCTLWFGVTHSKLVAFSALLHTDTEPSLLAYTGEINSWLRRWRCNAFLDVHDNMNFCSYVMYLYRQPIATDMLTACLFCFWCINWWLIESTCNLFVNWRLLH